MVREDADLRKALKYADEIEQIFYEINYRAGDDQKIKKRFVDLIDAIENYISYGYLDDELYSER